MTPRDRRRILDPSEHRVLRPPPRTQKPTPPPSPDPAPALRPVPIIRFAAPVCPTCGNPGKIRATALPIRYHRCLNPDCPVDLYQSIQTNYNAAAYASRKPKKPRRKP